MKITSLLTSSNPSIDPRATRPEVPCLSHEEVCAEERTAPRHRRHPQLLPDEREADLLRLGDGVQPARDRPVGPQLQVPQLLRLVRRVPSERLRAQGAGLARERFDLGHNHLTVRTQLVRGHRRPTRSVRVPTRSVALTRGTPMSCNTSWHRRTAANTSSQSPSMFVPSRCHWYVTFSPIANTLRVALCPT